MHVHIKSWALGISTLIFHQITNPVILHLEVNFLEYVSSK